MPRATRHGSPEGCLCRAPSAGRMEKMGATSQGVKDAIADCTELEVREVPPPCAASRPRAAADPIMCWVE